MKKEEYLDAFIFKELSNLNTGFDAKAIKYFSKEDFKIVLNRVEALDIKIRGIEPWKNGCFYDVKSCGDYKNYPSNSRWYWQAFEEFCLEDSDLMYAATYIISKDQLNDK